MLDATSMNIIKPLLNKGVNSLYSTPDSISISCVNDIYVFSRDHEGGIVEILLGASGFITCVFATSCMISDIDKDKLALCLALILMCIGMAIGTLCVIYSGIKTLHSKTHICLSANTFQIVETVFEKEIIYTTPSDQPIIFSTRIETYEKRVSGSHGSRYVTEQRKVLEISNTYLNKNLKPYRLTEDDYPVDWLENFLNQINTLIFGYPPQSDPQYLNDDPLDFSYENNDDGRVYNKEKYDNATLDISDVAKEITPVLRHMPSFDDNQYVSIPSEHIALSGRYHNLTKIGDGAQGSMFRALDQNNQPVGIKVYNFLNFQSWKDEELFEREVETLKSLHFKGIPKYIEFIAHNPLYYLVESYIPAPSMAKRIKNGERITFENALLLLINIAEVLNYLESLTPPVIHRDIKPDNLLIDDEYNVWLVDFGVVAAANQKTNAMTFAGTAGYMAPEQIMGKVTPAADIYSAGISMLAYLTGKEPTDMKLDGLNIDVKAELPDSIPAWFKQLLLDMTDPAPGNRISKAASIAAIIRDHIDNAYDNEINQGYRNQNQSSYSQYV